VQEQANFWECEVFLPKFPQTFPKKTSKKLTSKKKIEFVSNQDTSNAFCKHLKAFPSLQWGDRKNPEVIYSILPEARKITKNRGNA